MNDDADSGWTYYGRSRHLTGKSHFLLSQTTQSICHLYTFTADDMKHIKITNMSNLFKSQLCKRCLDVLATRAMSH